jgi:hypothetical protein
MLVCVIPSVLPNMYLILLETMQVSYQSCRMNEHTTSAKRYIIASIKAMPEGTEEKYRNCAMKAIIDNITKPICSGTIPVVQKLLQTSTQLNINITKQKPVSCVQ